MAGSIHQLIKKLSTAFTARGQQLQAKALSTDFFEQEISFASIIRLFDRKAYFEKLKALDQAPHKTSDWVAAKSPIEFMAGLERDTRARFRSRLDHYKAAAISKQVPPMILEQYRTVIDSIDSLE